MMHEKPISIIDITSDAVTVSNSRWEIPVDPDVG